MQCRKHPEKSGINTCNQCGDWLCDSCSFECKGRIFCPFCATQQAKNEDIETHHHTIRDVKNPISWGLLFLFSVVIPLPGANYMYMGLIKRGLMAMFAFFGIIYLGIHLSHLGLLFWFSIPVLYLACTFDGFRLRTLINAGEIVTDGIDDIMPFIRRNMGTLVGLLVLLIITNMIGLASHRTVNLLQNLPLILIVIWAIRTWSRHQKGKP